MPKLQQVCVGTAGSPIISTIVTTRDNISIDNTGGGWWRCANATETA